ncbi:hypothetical protein ACFOG5_19715 [Pedobacter fastidiosus]|uniref:hypothetical protein n=1 Tax=Pedobacter fastidiosus TaxID=2765361 RepID=UPI0036234EC0
MSEVILSKTFNLNRNIYELYHHHSKHKGSKPLNRKIIQKPNTILVQNLVAEIKYPINLDTVILASNKYFIFMADYSQ